MISHREKSQEEINIRIEIENLTRLVSQLLTTNGSLRPSEIEQLRAMIQERKDSLRYRRTVRIYTGYFAAAVVFFYTIKEYVAIFWVWLKATLK